MIPFPESRKAKVLPVLVLSRFPFLCRDQIPGLEKIQGDWTQRRGAGFFRRQARVRERKEAVIMTARSARQEFGTRTQSAG